MKRWGWILRWVGTAAGIAYVVSLIDLDDVKGAFGRIEITLAMRLDSPKNAVMPAMSQASSALKP